MIANNPYLKWLSQNWFVMHDREDSKGKMGIYTGQLHAYINYDNDVRTGGCLPDHKPAGYEDFARLFNNAENITAKFVWIDSSGNHLFEEETSMPDIVTFGVWNKEVVQLSVMKKVIYCWIVRVLNFIRS